MAALVGCHVSDDPTLNSGMERRIGTSRLVQDVALIKEMQLQQNITLAALRQRVDSLWDSYQQNIGELRSSSRAQLWWRWSLSLAVVALGSVLTERIIVHP